MHGKLNHARAPCASVSCGEDRLVNDRTVMLVRGPGPRAETDVIGLDLGVTESVKKKSLSVPPTVTVTV